MYVFTRTSTTPHGNGNAHKSLRLVSFEKDQRKQLATKKSSVKFESCSDGDDLVSNVKTHVCIVKNIRTAHYRVATGGLSKVKWGLLLFHPRNLYVGMLSFLIPKRDQNGRKLHSKNALVHL